MEESSSRNKISLEEAEAKNLVSDKRLGPDPVPFGFINDRWKALLAQMQPGDELWEFCSSDESWEHLAGRAGIELRRKGEVIATIMTKIS